jgi:phospholipid/cholesterol/gamma-HCH transport system substrate-binding protein
MESRASHALIGLLTLAIVAGLLGFTFWFGSGTTETVNVRLVFNSDISGLGRGSSVLFNGLKVGEVTQVEIEPTNPRQINATIKVSRSTPLRADTSARLEGQGLAGVVAVQLRGGDPSAAALLPAAGRSLPDIAAEPSEDIIKRVGSIARNIDGALVGIEGAINSNAGPISASIAEAERSTRAQAEYIGGLDKLMKGIETTAEFIGPLPDKLQAFSDGVLDNIRPIDPGRVARVIDDIDKFSAGLGAAAPEVSTAIKNAASTTQKLNTAADQFDSVLKGAQAYLDAANGENGRKLLEEVTDYAKYLRELARTLDTRSAALTVQIARSTASGLQSLGKVTTDSQHWLARFMRSLREVNQNPQGLLFGDRGRLPQHRGSR